MTNPMARHDEIAAALQLALLLEVSAYPKPGNIHRTRDFERTRFEHFLASASALGPQFRLAALRGSTIARGSINTKLMIGERIRCAVEACSRWQHGGNTSLGSILLLVPIAYAAGMTRPRSRLTPAMIRQNLRKVVRRTTPADAVDVYKAIRVATPGGIGTAPELDINDDDSTAEIRRRGLSLLDIFRISASYDSISSEWANDFPITFEIGLPALTTELRSSGDINKAIVDTYLKILSRIPDTLIARKKGEATARQVTSRAKRVMKLEGMKTPQGRRAILQMDHELQRRGNEWNPGTTADLTASALSVLVLSGFRP